MEECPERARGVNGATIRRLKRNLPKRNKFPPLRSTLARSDRLIGHDLELCLWPVWPAFIREDDRTTAHPVWDAGASAISSARFLAGHPTDPAQPPTPAAHARFLIAGELGGSRRRGNPAPTKRRPPRWNESRDTGGRRFVAAAPAYNFCGLLCNAYPDKERRLGTGTFLALSERQGREAKRCGVKKSKPAASIFLPSIFLPP